MHRCSRNIKFNNFVFRSVSPLFCDSDPGQIRNKTLAQQPLRPYEFPKFILVDEGCLATIGLWRKPGLQHHSRCKINSKCITKEGSLRQGKADDSEKSSQRATKELWAQREMRWFSTNAPAAQPLDTCTAGRARAVRAQDKLIEKMDRHTEFCFQQRQSFHFLIQSWK